MIEKGEREGCAHPPHSLSPMLSLEVEALAHNQHNRLIGNEHPVEDDDAAFFTSVFYGNLNTSPLRRVDLSTVRNFTCPGMALHFQVSGLDRRLLGGPKSVC